MKPNTAVAIVSALRDYRRHIAVGLMILGMAVVHPAVARETPEPLDHWHDVIRQTPYWASQGMYVNLRTIRRWVLSTEAYCERRDRHLLFDARASFLAYVDDAETSAETQERLNSRRQSLAADGRVDAWVAGQDGVTGYPFALSCDQPDARLEESVARYSGADESARLWGTWDGMAIGTESDPVSLHRAIVEVFRDRSERGRISLPEDILSTLAGKTIIESGGLREAHSAADARGIMQLTPGALGDCELEREFHFHRMAQIDCALRLWEQNGRNLRPVFDQVFGHLPRRKAETLYSLLLLQAYHAGVGRMQSVLSDDELGRAARYFAEHHERFSAQDIALGLVFHNQGRADFGRASVYYLTDVLIAEEAACASVEQLPGCQR